MPEAAVIHIACSADARLIPDCGVMLRSLFTANAGEHFEVHFLHDDRLPAVELDGLAAIAREFVARFSPQCVSPEAARDFPMTERFGLNAWYRVLLPELLPQVARLLYLDSDLLILGALRELWDTPLDGRLLAAVTQPIPDEMQARVRDTLGLAGREEYFNSGVMLLDLDGLRRTGTTRRVVEFIRAGRAPMPWADQDPLNAVLRGQRMELHPRWNVMTPMFGARALPPFTPQQLGDATAQPRIVHFIGEFKPLHYRCRHPYRQRWFEHVRHTRWKDLPVHGRSLKHMLLRPLPWALQFRVEGWLQRLRSALARARWPEKGAT